MKEKDELNFFLEIGKVKRMEQRGYMLRGIKRPTTVGSHSFREAFMGWVLGNEVSGLNTGHTIKIILIHDLCAGYAGDITPYEPIIKSSKQQKDIFTKWVRLSQKEKERFHKKQLALEEKALLKLTKKLSPATGQEMKSLWNEYKTGVTREGRFVQQLDMLENFLQSLEYWKEDKKFPIESWWQQMKELLSEPVLKDFLATLDESFYKPEIQNAKKKRA